MQGMMLVYALFTGVIILILLTAVIVAGVSAVVRKIRGPRGGAKPPEES